MTREKIDFVYETLGVELFADFQEVGAAGISNLSK